MKQDVDDLEMIPNFEDGVVGVRRDANALAVVAITLGVSDEESPLKGFVPAYVEIASQIDKAKTSADVKKYVDALSSVQSGSPVKKSLEWTKVASLRPLMKNALPSLSTDVKRLSRNEKTFLRSDNAQKVIDKSTIMVAIALSCRENVVETQAPDEEKIWREYCEKLAVAALDFNKQANAVLAKKGAFDDMKAAFKAVEDSCSSTCHEKFGGQAAE